MVTPPRVTEQGDTPRQTWLKAVVNRHAEGNLTAFAERYEFDYTGLNLMRSGKRPISDKTVAAICSRLRIDPPEGDPVYGPKGINPIPAESTPQPAIPDMVASIARLEQSVAGLVSAQVMLLQRIEELLKERQGAQ